MIIQYYSSYFKVWSSDFSIDRSTSDETVEIIKWVLGIR
jgi:hypothetical protein